MSRVIRSLAVAGVTMGLVVAALTQPAAAESRWSGYPIPATGTAAGGWIGGYQEGRAKVYRIDPGAHPRASAHRAARRVVNLNGSRRPGRVPTSRAAWILGKYGHHRLDVQSAAVDAAVLHLLAGGQWRIGARRGGQRIARTAAPSDVRRFARTMLAQSRKHRGPYTIRLRASDVAAGGVTRGRVTVRSAKGRPVTGRPVTFRVPGADPVKAFTDSRGRATAMLPTTDPGRHRMRARVAGLPDWALRVRAPRHTRASRVVVAGARKSRVVRASFSATVTQQVKVTTRAAKVGLSTPLTGSWSVTGTGGTRTVTYGLHGPFSSSASATCTQTAAVTSSAQITQDGTYPLPSWRVDRPGYWVWSVRVGANETNQASSACDGTTIAKSEPTAALKHLGGSPVAKGSTVRGEVTVRGLPTSAPVTVRGRLHGPFAKKDNTKCTAARQYKQPAISFTGNGTKRTPFVKVKETGFYVWQAVVFEGPLSMPAQSGCGQRFRVD